MEEPIREILTDVLRFLDDFAFGIGTEDLATRVRSILSEPTYELVQLPRSIHRAECKKCGVPIFFARSFQGRWVPMVTKGISTSDFLVDGVAIKFIGGGEAHMVRDLDSPTRWVTHGVFCGTTEPPDGILRHLWEETQGARQDAIAEGLGALVGILETTNA